MKIPPPVRNRVQLDQKGLPVGMSEYRHLKNNHNINKD